jgi:hypothetical protein
MSTHSALIRPCCRAVYYGVWLTVARNSAGTDIDLVTRRSRGADETLSNVNERFLHVLRAEVLGGKDGCQVGLEGVQSALPERLQCLAYIFMPLEITAGHLSVGENARVGVLRERPTHLADKIHVGRLWLSWKLRVIAVEHAFGQCGRSVALGDPGQLSGRKSQ